MLLRHKSRYGIDCIVIDDPPTPFLPIKCSQCHVRLISPTHYEILFPLRSHCQQIAKASGP